MKQSIKQSIHTYAAWRKGVLLMAPLEILLIAVVAGLLVMTIMVSMASTAGKKSITALKSYLQGLQPRLSNDGTINPEAERRNMETLLNKVKATCEQPVISRNMELKELLSQTQTRMGAMHSQRPGKQGAWLQLKSVTNSFYELYYPA